MSTPDRTLALTGSAILENEVGLHARPSVKLTQLAKRFAATIELSLGPDGPWTDAKSPVKVMRVKASKGATLHFRVAGAEAGEALAAMLGLVADRFGEERGTGGGSSASATAGPTGRPQS